MTGEHFADLGRLEQLIAPPYDVITEPERAQFAARSAHNIVHLILPQGNGDRYAAAAKTLDAWRSAGAIVREPDPAAYVLAQEFTTDDGRSHVRTGLLAGVAVEPYSTGRVRPHEKTHAGPKADRLALLRATRTMFESLFFLAPDRAGELSRMLAAVTRAKPWARASLAGVESRVWRVTGAEATALTKAAGHTIYIADGHHRFETAVAYHGENPRADRTAGLIVPLGDPGLVVLATHRLISGGAISEEKVTAALGGAFTIEVIEPELDATALLADRARSGTSCIVALPQGHTLLLTLKPGANVSAAGTGIAARLDVARIDALVVAPLKGLAGNEATVGYSASAGDVVSKVGSGKVAAVMLSPTRVDDVLAVADAGEFMPQKSTYFVPKVPSGLVLLPVG